MLLIVSSFNAGPKWSPYTICMILSCIRVMFTRTLLFIVIVSKNHTSLLFSKRGWGGVGELVMLDREMLGDEWNYKLFHRQQSSFITKTRKIRRLIKTALRWSLPGVDVMRFNGKLARQLQ